MTNSSKSSQLPCFICFSQILSVNIIPVSISLCMWVCAYVHLCMHTRMHKFVCLQRPLPWYICGGHEIIYGSGFFICYVSLSDWMQLFRVSSRYFYPLTHHTVPSICSKEVSKLQNSFFGLQQWSNILSTFFCIYVCVTTTDDCSYLVSFFSWPLDEYLLWLIHSVFTTAFPAVIFTLTNRGKQY